MNLTRTFDAESETLSLTDVKTQLRITDSADDEALVAFIAAIRHRTENYLRKTLVTSTWELKLDCIEGEIYLPMNPIQSITSVQYLDTDGNTQTLASSGYQFDASGRLAPSYGNDWPSTRDQFNAVTITYVAGQTHAGNVPEDIKHAMLMLVGTADIAREDVVIGAGVVVSSLGNRAAESLLAPHRNWKL